MSEPEVLECSWLPTRVLIGQGRVQINGIYFDCSGTLDIVRDSTVNARNDYQVFGETFTNTTGIIHGSNPPGA